MTYVVKILKKNCSIWFYFYDNNKEALMQQHMTITEIAKESGVSISTVSRVLNGKVPVSEDKRLRVEATIKKYNYSPNALARSLVFKQSMTIGVILPDISNPYFSTVFCEIEKAAHNAGYSLLLCNTLYSSSTDIHLEEDYIQMMIDKHVDGLIIAGGQQDMVAPSQVYLDALKRAATTVPLVMIGEKIPDIPCLFLDREQKNGIQEAVKYLASLGHKKIAFLGGEDNVKITLKRVNSYKKAMEACGLPIDERLIVLSDYYPKDGFEAANRLLEQEIPFTAALAINDNVALGASRAFADHGLRIPEDLSLISCEFFLASDFFVPRITVLDQHNNRFGKLVIQKLLNVIQGEQETDEIDIQTDLLIRESCGAPSH